MNTQFKNLVEKFSLSPSNEHILEEIRLQGLSLIGKDEEFPSYVSYFRKKAKQANSVQGEALSYVMEVWYTLPQDIDKSLEINDKAFNLFKTLDNYEYRVGYLSIINNYFIIYNFLGQIDKSYALLEANIELAKKSNQVSYFVAFSNNSTNILNSVGLYEEALRNLREVFTFKDYVSITNLLSTRFLYINQLLLLKKYDEVKEQVAIALKENEICHVFNPALFLRALLIVAIENDDKEEADKYFKDINKIGKPIVESVNNDRYLILLTVGRYYLYIKDYVKAKEILEQVYENSRFLQSSLCLIFSVMEHLYIETEDYKNAVKIYQEEKEYYNIGRGILQKIKNNEDAQEKSTTLIYKKLFLTVKDLLSLNNDLSFAMSIKQLPNTLERHLSNVFPSSSYLIIDINQSCHTSYLLSSELSTPLNYSCSLIKKILKCKDFSLKLTDNDLHLLEITNVDKNQTILFPLKKDNNEIIGALILKSKEVINVELNEMEQIMELVTDSLSVTLANIKSYKTILSNSTIDELTQTLNRHGLKQLLTKFLTIPEQEECLLFLDIDDFKLINDTYGHVAGDLVLQDLSSHLSSTFGSEYVARTGGEEFVAFIFGNKEKATNKINELYSKVKLSSVKFNNENIAYSISCGAKMCSTLDDQKAIYKKTDKLLYLAKSTGKNKFYIE